jgi:cytochrome c oxidase subunit II
MAISSPQVRLWWNQPIHRVELVWIVVAFLWGIVMFGMMVYWHAFGKQNLSTETYKVAPNEYFAKTEIMVGKYKVREEQGMPVVHPPPGSDVYLTARVWAWYPLLEFEQGQTYRLHLSSIDLQHGFSLQPMNINIQVHPGYEHVLTVTADQARELTIICNEYCGFGHHTMVGKLYVVAK